MHYQYLVVGAGLFGAVFARSGLATKQGLRPGNCVGVVDEDYRGEFAVALHNDTDEPQTINPMERIAQLVIMPYLSVEFNEVDELNETGKSSALIPHMGISCSAITFCAWVKLPSTKLRLFITPNFLVIGSSSS